MIAVYFLCVYLCYYFHLFLSDSEKDSFFYSRALEISFSSVMTSDVVTYECSKAYSIYFQPNINFFRQIIFMSHCTFVFSTEKLHCL